MIENSTLGLTMLDGDRKVVVTGEEHHQDVLWAYTPHAGRARRVAVELVPTGGRRIEARLDGRRVGELTALMSQRYGRIVDDVQRHGGRVGCLGLVVAGKRGIEVELRLPTVGPGRPVPTGAAPTLRQPGPPLPRLPGPDATGPGLPPTRRRSRKPLWVGGGVVAVLVVAAAVGGTHDATPTATPAATSLPTVAAVAAPPTTAPTTVGPTTVREAAVNEGDGAAQAGQAPRKTSAAARPAPQPVVDAPAARAVPDPAPARAADPAPAGVSYKNCTEARKAGAAPLHVGDPGYRAGLDRDGDGVACE